MIYWVSEKLPFGLHRGIVVNPNKTSDSIRLAIEEAELNSGVNINSVSVGIAGHYIRCIQSSSIIGINNSDRIIQEDDIIRLIEQAKITENAERHNNNRCNTSGIYN
ncbi:MAG: hypothetical protein R2942_07830 [Ignavibacteria bacterium]